jgi:hypothetical protein
MDMFCFWFYNNTPHYPVRRSNSAAKTSHEPDAPASTSVQAGPGQQKSKDCEDTVPSDLRIGAAGVNEKSPRLADRSDNAAGPQKQIQESQRVDPSPDLKTKTDTRARDEPEYVCERCKDGFK